MENWKAIAFIYMVDELNTSMFIISYKDVISKASLLPFIGRENISNVQGTFISCVSFKSIRPLQNQGFFLLVTFKSI